MDTLWTYSGSLRRLGPRGTGGDVLAVFAAARDVTKLTEAGKAARSMIESSLDSLVAISPEGMITDANEATVAITGVPRDELIGTAFSDYFTDPERANRICQLVSKGDGCGLPTLDTPPGRGSGRGSYNASVYRDADGNVLGVFAAARDVTKRVQEQKKNVEQQAREQEQLVDLQQFQRLTVGHELEMTELKKNEFLRGLLPEGAAQSDEDQR
jgi:PAS domain-containing protein